MKKLDSYYSKVENIISMYKGDNFAIYAHIMPILNDVYDLGHADGFAEGYYEYSGYNEEPQYDDDCYDDEEYDYSPDPMESAEAAFAYIDECEYDESSCCVSSIEELYDEFSKQQEDDEISEWVNTPHDDMNVELKQIDKEIEDRKIDESIWHARELMMNKIVFSNGDSYPIHYISWEVDDNNIPVDIVISSRRKYLDYIAENHCQLGYNCNDEETYGFNEALYGRLDKFCVVDYEGKVILIS